MVTEKRRRTRARVHFDVTARVGRENLSLETENISLGGMLCRPDERFRAGEEVGIRIVQHNTDDADLIERELAKAVF